MLHATVITRLRKPTTRDQNHRVIATYGRATRADLFAYDSKYAEETNHKRAALTLAQAVWTYPQHVASYRLGTSPDKWVHVFSY